MIKINEQETIIDVVNKINECTDKEILLEFPFWHQILHNYLSLKIIKNKAWNKRITILTNDLISKKIWENIWINYSIVKDPDFFKERSIKQELLKHNFTFFEYFLFEVKKYFRKIINFLWAKAWIDSLKYYSPYDNVKKSWVFFLLVWVLTSLWMLIFIFYFAVSKTYIEITPEVEIKTKATNIVYEEQNIENSVLSKWTSIQLKKISEVIELEDKYKTTWIDYENTKRAVAQISIINELREEQTFRPKTRLLSPEWIVFETTDWIKIPGKTTNWSWEVIFWSWVWMALAKVYDEKWNFVGNRWNIKSWIFTIPWLKFNQDKIYAKLLWPATWWENNISYLVWDEDVENAKKILEERLKREVLNKLKEKIKADNKTNSIEYEILPIKDIINYSDLDIKTIWEIKAGQKIENFNLKWKIKVEAYIYNKTHAISTLKNVVQESLLTWTDKLMFIDAKSLRMSVVLDRKENPLKIKATTEVDVWISFDFDNNENYYNQRLKSMILWLDNKEAMNILLNDTKINTTTIKNTPFFISKVSWNLDNIIFKIKN